MPEYLSGFSQSWQEEHPEWEFRPLKMKRSLIILATIFLFFSCQNEEKGGLLEIPVDIDLKKVAFPLSEITEGEVMAIELELTDESIIGGIYNACLCNDKIIIVSGYPVYDLLVFGIDGNFIRKIRYKGQGPGELSGGINIMAIDEKKNQLYLTAAKKIVCYDLDGKFIKELTHDLIILKGMNYINNELLVAGERIEKKGEGYDKQSVIYRFSDELQLLDSCIIRNAYLETLSTTVSFSPYDIYFSIIDSTIYSYYPESLPFKEIPKVLRDTLYRFENNRLVPELKLKFNYSNNLLENNHFQLNSIFQTSRFVFVPYHFASAQNLYIYDMIEKKAYNIVVSDGTLKEDRIFVRLFLNNPEMFYYSLTNFKPDDFEEPNPTLYIGKLKTPTDK